VRELSGFNPAHAEDRGQLQANFWHRWDTAGFDLVERGWAAVDILRRAADAVSKTMVQNDGPLAKTTRALCAQLAKTPRPRPLCSGGSAQRGAVAAAVVRAGAHPGDGADCRGVGAVPPPEHNYPDQNSELAEIYLRF
jgi:hypothetical protein